jgi:GNAT superfamily N-acetyltransferase
MSSRAAVPVRIRPAVLDDAAAIAELVTELGYPTDAAAMRARLEPILADPDRATLVAEVGGGVVGVAGALVDRYYEKDGCFSQLVVLSVDERVRGAGVGRALAGAIEEWSARRGAREVIVHSGLQRDGAHRFYEGCGYERTGYRFVRRLERDE